MQVPWRYIGVMLVGLVLGFGWWAVRPTVRQDAVVRGGEPEAASPAVRRPTGTQSASVRPDNGAVHWLPVAHLQSGGFPVDWPPAPRDEAAPAEGMLTVDELLWRIADDPETTESRRRQYVLHLLDELREGAYDDAERLAALSRTKDTVDGETQQMICKELARLATAGGNDYLVDSFLNRPDTMNGIDAMRLLSYLDSAYPLSTDAVERLAGAYVSLAGTELGPVVLRALADAGGTAGVAWIIDRGSREVATGEWLNLLDALGHSANPAAKEALHALLNDLAANGESDNEMARMVRSYLRN